MLVDSELGDETATVSSISTISVRFKGLDGICWSIHQAGVLTACLRLEAELIHPGFHRLPCQFGFKISPSEYWELTIQGWTLQIRAKL